MQVLKQRRARTLLPRRKRRNPRQRELFGEEPRRAFWQARFYDFNVWTPKKRVEKLRYMHRNPVKRGLVDSPEQWWWSSYRHYFLGEVGPVKVNVGWSEISFRHRVARGGGQKTAWLSGDVVPALAKNARTGHPQVWWCRTTVSQSPSKGGPPVTLRADTRVGIPRLRSG